MPTLTIVVGLPGSGKSSLIQTMQDADPGLLVADDYHAAAHDDSPEVTASRHYPAVVHALRGGRNCVVSDIAFTDTARRDALARVFRLDAPGAGVVWVFFMNDLPRCVANIRRRNRDGRDAEIALARWFASRYFLPPDVTPRPVWRSPGEGDAT